MILTIYHSGSAGNAGNIYYPHCVEVTNKEELLAAVKYDHVCGQFKDNKRSNDNFITSNCLVMDCDNDFSDEPGDWINMEDIPAFFPGISLAVVASRHHNKEKDGKTARPRFHVYFAISTVTNANAYSTLKRTIQSAYHVFDNNALDAARFIFGCESKEAIWINGSVTIDKYIRSMESSVIPEGMRNSTLSHTAGKIIKRYGDTPEAREIFDKEAARCEPPLGDSELDTIWASAQRFGKKISQQEGYVVPEEYNNDFHKQRLTFQPKDYSDIGQAEVMAKHLYHQLRYSDGTDYVRFVTDHWLETRSQATAAAEYFLKFQLADAKTERDEAIKACIEAGIDEAVLKMGKKNMPKDLTAEQVKLFVRYVHSLDYLAFVMKRRDMKYVKAALEAAKPMLEVETDDFDHDPFLLNTPAGTYDLESGLSGMKPHDPEDLITKMTSVSPGDTGKEIWKECLNTIFCGDQELQNYVQQVVGFCAIGKVYREVMIISYGSGANGKSTFWNAINDVLGSYGGQMSAETLTTGNKLNTKPEIAEMKGKRLVLAAELQEGQRLNTSIVKKLCSTDRVFAEKKYKSPFSFYPSHTIVLFTNYLPRVGASDQGTWRRLVVIPFNAVIPENKDIKNYASYLVENAGPAILSWIIDGARQAIANGFQMEMPQCVSDAIGAYREENNWLGHYLEERCEIQSNFTQKSGELYRDYRQYCQETGEYTRSTTDFYNALELAGFTRRKITKGSFIYGLRIRELDFLS